MCLSATALMLAGTGMQAISAVQQGQSANAYGRYQKQVADRDAANAEGAGRVQAKKIREAGRRARADAVAAVAASGMDINSQSAQDIETGIGADYEADALAAVYSGRNEAMVRRSEGAAAAKRGRQQQRNALMVGASTVASGWGQINPSRVAAPISRQDIGYRG